MPEMGRHGAVSVVMSAPVLEMRGISKRFPGVTALSGVSLQLYRGEVHMLLGENGAGKSTLMKILFGAYQANDGELLLDGRPVVVSDPLHARKLGIAVIFQEFTLVPYLTVAENVFLGREPHGRLPGTIAFRRMEAETRRLLDLLGLSCGPRALAGQLGVAQQQLVEIAKALSQDARVLVMDEPTATLSDRECERLFAVIRDLRAKGVAVVYISHRMPEVFELGDRITVLRDGRNVCSLLPSETNPAELVGLMIGHTLSTGRAASARTAREGADALAVDGLETANGVNGVSLTVRPGEIVGLTGLVGSGRTEVARAVFGLDTIRAGSVRIWGEEFRGSPAEAVRRGVALIPESRKSEGLALIRSVRDNVVVAGLRTRFPFLFSPKRANGFAREMIAALGIATPSARQVVKVLSGGNQQKVVIGKWLVAQSRLFIFDEPTRGIDVGAKAEIFRLIGQLVDQGAAVLMISSEFAEVAQVCDRAYVMRDGRIAGELPWAELSEPALLGLSIGHG